MLVEAHGVVHGFSRAATANIYGIEKILCNYILKQEVRYKNA